MKGAELDQAWLVTARNLGIDKDVLQPILGRLAALDRHHRPTAEHCRRVGIVAAQIGEHESLPAKPLFYGGSLHDLGKHCVEAERLSKTDNWTPADAEALRSHPIDGYKEIVEMGMQVTAGLVVRHHTFQSDPYPAPDHVPAAPPYMSAEFEACARIIALADYYDAAHRANSAGLSSGEAIKEKILEHNPDLSETIAALYYDSIFSTAQPPF